MISISVGFLSPCGAKITIILYVTKKFQLFFFSNSQDLTQNVLCTILHQLNILP